MDKQQYAVNGGRIVRVSFGAEAAPESRLAVEHVQNESILAHETRVIPDGATFLEFKTHPNSSHINCAILCGEKDFSEASLKVECGDQAEPIGRHFIVIGAMKAGTTTLFRTLEQHPRLCRTWSEGPGPSFVKEVNYFRKQYRHGDTPLHYDWRFPFVAGAHAWTLDVSPNYAKLPGSETVPSRIASLGADVKIAYILRDPVDRAESHIAHGLQNDTPVQNIEHCTRVSCYAMHLDNFTEHIAEENIILLDFEQLRRDPVTLFRKIYDFLDIDFIAPEVDVHNRRSHGYEMQSDLRREIADSVRPDIQRLIDEYGFNAARKWLNLPERRWFGVSNDVR